MINQLAALHRGFWAKIHQVGFRETIKLAGLKFWKELSGTDEKQAKHAFDLKYGTDTSGVVELGALDLPEDRLRHAVRYQSAIIEVFAQILEALPISHQAFTFIDLGSGKGRALLIASRFPYKRIIGVELSLQLHRIACENIRIYRDDAQQCHTIESISEDAANYEFPDDNLVVYLFNPFDREIIRSVARNLERVLHKSRKLIFVVYLKPLWREVFDQASFLKIFRETDRYVVYKGGEVADEPTAKG